MLRNEAQEGRIHEAEEKDRKRKEVETLSSQDRCGFAWEYIRDESSGGEVEPRNNAGRNVDRMIQRFPENCK